MKMRDENGGSLIEFAVIAPLLFVILFGIIEFGLLLFDMAMITNASREGARAGIVFSDPRISDAGIRGVVKTYCNTHLISFGASSDLTDANILIDPAGNRSTLPAGSSLKMSVNYPYRFLVFSNVIALIGSHFLNPVNLHAESIMRLE